MPECQELKVLFDISGWIGEHVLPMKNHVYPHAFRFFMGEDKKAQMQYKNWATDATWLPRGEPFTILRSIPKGIPSLVRPILGRKEGMQLNDLLGKIETGSNRMTDAQLKWWRDFVKEEESVRTLWDSMSVE